MATVLCVWELGTALGHLSQLRRPIEVALRMGHRVVVAGRQLHRVNEVLAGLPVLYLQAPFKQNVEVADASVFHSYTHLLARQCFSGVDELEIYLRVWRNVFDLVKPDLVIYEHSPTALIASGGLGFKKLMVGSGFTVPPLPASASEPFAPFVTTANTPDMRAGLLADDALVLWVINEALARLGSPPWGSLAAVFEQANEQWLMTWPELDQFGPRVGARYLGGAKPDPRQAPHWPSGDGPKVFGYLQNFRSLEVLLRDLTEARVRALLVIANLPQHLKEGYTSEWVSFSDHLVDLSLVASQVDWVINHANQSTVANFVGTGVPQLVIPCQQEQLFLALRLKAHGSALMAYQDQNSYAIEIGQMASNAALKQHALHLQARCAASVTVQASDVMSQTFNDLLPKNV